MTTQGEPKVWVFFYGSNINFEVLKDGGLVPGEWEVACSPTATHTELGRLYRDYVQGKLGQIYLPEAA